MASRVATVDISLGIGVLEFGIYNNGVFSAYTDVGAIKGTFTGTYTREVHMFETGQPLVDVKHQVLREHLEIAFQMAEIRVANLKMALGGGVQTLSTSGATFLDGTGVAPLGDLTTSVIGVGVNDKITFGGQCDIAIFGLRFTHIKGCTTGKRQILEVFQATPTGTLAMAFNEGDWNQWEVTFRALADTTRPSGSQIFQFINEI